MPIENTLSNPSQNQPSNYLPDPKKLTDDAASQTVKQSGAGATVVVEHHDFQSTAEGDIEGNQAGSHATVSGSVMHDAERVSVATARPDEKPPEEPTDTISSLPDQGSEGTADTSNTTTGSPLMPAPNPEALTVNFSSLLTTVTGLFTLGRTKTDDMDGPLPYAGGDEDAGNTNLDDLGAVGAASTASTSTSSSLFMEDMDEVGKSGTVGSIQSAPLTDEELEQVSQFASTDASQVLAYLQKIVPLSATSSAEELAALQHLAEKIAQANKTSASDELDSLDLATVVAALMSLYGGDDPAIIEIITNSIAKSIVSLNTSYQTSLQSTDSAVVLAALRAKANIENADLSPEGKIVALNYLGLMAEALAFMSQIRARIATKESELTMEQAKAKTKMLDDIVHLALNQFQATLDKIQVNLEQVQKQQAEQAKWKVLGPLITGLSGLVAVILTVATLGVGSPLAVALLATTIAMTSLMIADQTSHILDKMCDAMGVSKDAGVREAVKFAVILAVTIVMMVVTLGVAGPAMLGTAGFMAATNAAALGATQATVTATMLLLMEALFSSGLITAGFQALAKKCFPDDEQAQMIFALVMTVVTMMVCAYAMSKAAGPITAELTKGATRATATAASTAATTEAGIELTELGGARSGAATETASETAGATRPSGAAEEAGAGTVRGAVNVATTEGAALANETISQTNSMASRLLKRISDAMKEAMEEKKTELLLALMQLVTAGLQAGAQAEQGITEQTLSEMSTQEAQLTGAVAQFTAMNDLFQSLLPGYDKTIRTLQDDTKEINEAVTGMCTMFTQFIGGLSGIVNRATQG